MLSALEKWLMSRAGDVASLRRLSIPQLVGKGARKTAEAARDSYAAVKESPKLAAAAAGLGAAGGMAMGQEDEGQGFEAELQALREKYGL